MVWGTAAVAEPASVSGVGRGSSCACYVCCVKGKSTKLSTDPKMKGLQFRLPANCVTNIQVPDSSKLRDKYRYPSCYLSCPLRSCLVTYVCARTAAAATASEPGGASGIRPYQDPRSKIQQFGIAMPHLMPHPLLIKYNLMCSGRKKELTTPLR